MKIIKHTKILTLVFLAVAVFSCDNDDDASSSQSSDLIGVWQRSDFSKKFEYTLIFEPDEFGFRTVRETNIEDGTEISNAIPFNWTTNDDILTIDFNDEIVVTSFEINANGQLLLSDLTDLFFVRLE